MNIVIRGMRNVVNVQSAKQKETILSNWFILNRRLTVSIGLKGSVADNENAPKSTEVTFYNRKAANREKSINKKLLTQNKTKPFLYQT